MSKKTKLDRLQDMVRSGVRNVRYNGREKHVLVVFGAQRSGTSLMLDTFEKLPFCKIYRESSELNSKDPYQLRLNPLDEVLEKIRSDRAHLVVIKPLVESQDAYRVLDAIPGSRAIWVYRNFHDVVASGRKLFGDEAGAVNLIRPIVDEEFRKKPWNTWRYERVSDETRALIETHFSMDMNPNDAAALFWYTRNRLFYEQGLDTEERVTLIKYENFVTRPFVFLAYILNIFGIRQVSEEACSVPHAQSIGKGRRADMSSDVLTICEEGLAQLDRTYEASSYGQVFSLMAD